VLVLRDAGVVYLGKQDIPSKSLSLHLGLIPSGLVLVAGRRPVVECLLRTFDFMGMNKTPWLDHVLPQLHIPSDEGPRLQIKVRHALTVPQKGVTRLNSSHSVFLSIYRQMH
jgi:hypothetical protein